MNKLTMESLDMTKANIDKIAELLTLEFEAKFHHEKQFNKQLEIAAEIKKTRLHHQHLISGRGITGTAVQR